MIQLDFPPLCGPSIETVVNETYNLKTVLPELIDNALDKRATVIKMYAEENAFVVEDNGSGVSNMVSLLQWGRHDKGDSRSTMGRYGIGFKKAAIWLASAFEVETRHRNEKWTLAVDWAALTQWSTTMRDPRPDPGPSYTRFIFAGILRNRLKKLNQSREHLAYEFGPALRAGVRLELNGVAIEAAPMPALVDAQVFDGSFEGRHFRLTAGIKVAGDTPRQCGFDVVYMHRLIMQGDKYGCGDYSPQRFYGYLELLDDGEEVWTVPTLKSGDFAEHDALFGYLFEEVEPILAAAQEMGDQIEMREWREELLDRLSAVMKVRERRGGPRKQREGTSEAKNSGATREKAKAADPTQPGNVLDKQMRGALDLRFDCKDPSKIGDVVRTKTTTIISLNLDLPVVKRKVTDATISIALALLAIHSCEHPEDFPLFRELSTETVREQFVERYTRLLQLAVLPEEESDCAAA